MSNEIVLAPSRLRVHYKQVLHSFNLNEIFSVSNQTKSIHFHLILYTLRMNFKAHYKYFIDQFIRLIQFKYNV